MNCFYSLIPVLGVKLLVDICEVKFSDVSPLGEIKYLSIAFLVVVVCVCACAHL